MRMNEISLRILVRGDYGTCFDFYTGKLGLVPVWGGREGPYTSLATAQGAAPCLALFAGEAMGSFQGYTQPAGRAPTDTVMGVIPSDDLDADYARLKAAGVEFLSEPQFIEGWGMRCVWLRDTEGNLLELNDAESI